MSDVDGVLKWFGSRRAGALEDVLARAYGGERTPYEWLARAVSASAHNVLDSPAVPVRWCSGSRSPGAQ